MTCAGESIGPHAMQTTWVATRVCPHHAEIVNSRGTSLIMGGRRIALMRAAETPVRVSHHDRAVDSFAATCRMRAHETHGHLHTAEDDPITDFLHASAAARPET